MTQDPHNEDSEELFHKEDLPEQLGPRMKNPRPTGPKDHRSSKDIEFDNAQAMSRLTPDDKDKLGKIQQMMDKEEDDEEQRDYDKGWYGESLKEIASQLGYLNEVDGMEGGNMSVSNKFDHSKFDFKEKVTKASFVYTEQGGHFYSLTLSTSNDRQIKLKYSEANSWLKDTLEYIHEGDLLPRRYNSGLEDLDLIVDRLKELNIEASHGDYMDVS